MFIIRKIITVHCGRKKEGSYVPSSPVRAQLMPHLCGLLKKHPGQSHWDWDKNCNSTGNLALYSSTRLSLESHQELAPL